MGDLHCAQSIEPHYQHPLPAFSDGKLLQDLRRSMTRPVLPNPPGVGPGRTAARVAVTASERVQNSAVGQVVLKLATRSRDSTTYLVMLTLEPKRLPVI